VAGAGDGAELEVREEEAVVAPDAGIWEQVRDVVVFAGPALGLWICGPLMSLIDTMVIGQTSSLQLAALGPYTILVLYCAVLSTPFASCGVLCGICLEGNTECAGDCFIF
jgi:Na+-driven multidrug efflux pump